MSSRKVLLLETTSLTPDLHTCHKHAGVNTTILTHSLQLLEIISNQDLWKKREQINCTVVIKRRKWKWVDHALSKKG